MLLWLGISLLWFQVSANCVRERHRLLRHRLVGVYHPQCDEDGSYKAKQCHGSTGFCWCVNDQGQRMNAPVPPGVRLDCA